LYRRRGDRADRAVLAPRQRDEHVDTRGRRGDDDLGLKVCALAGSQKGAVKRVPAQFHRATGQTCRSHGQCVSGP